LPKENIFLIKIKTNIYTKWFRTKNMHF